MATSCLGHLPQRHRDWRVFKCNRSSRVFGSARGCIIVWNLPIGMAGERLGNLSVVEEKRLGRIPVEHDLETSEAKRKVPGDHAIRVAQLRDADLGDQVYD